MNYIRKAGRYQWGNQKKKDKQYNGQIYKTLSTKHYTENGEWT